MEVSGSAQLLRNRIRNTASRVWLLILFFHLLGDRRTSSFYSPIADNVLSVKRSSALHRLNSHKLESSGGSHTSANQSEGSGTRSQPHTMFYSAVNVVFINSVLWIRITLKVPKCEIFDCSDFHYFYTIKPFWVDFVVKILTYYFNFWGSQASFSFWCASWAVSIRVRSWCVRSACASDPFAHAQYTHQSLARMLSMVWKPFQNLDFLRVCLAYA